MQVDIKFINTFQERIFNESRRNICGSGGFGNGKTTVFCQKLIALMCMFPNYRVGIFRKEYKKLAATTRVTFFKICPPELYDEKNGGSRADSVGYLRLINGSEVMWLHGDNTDDKILMGFEPNSIFVDQAEELDETTYDIMDGRVGRWDQAIIPDHLDQTLFPRNEATGKLIAPSYMLLACNPDDFDHYLYRRYHPKSEEYNRQQYDEVAGSYFKYSDTHVMYEAGSDENPAIPEENKSVLRKKGKSFVRRFYFGQWGIFEGQIHDISPLSVIENCPPGFIEQIIQSGNLFRVLDHGTSAPTCCLWFSIYKQWIICFREYYNIDARISEHRQAISDLSGDERYKENIADPAIFKAQSDKHGKTSCTSDDYSDMLLDAPPLFWSSADNHEYRTRNAINELLFCDSKIPHPITGQLNAPRLYFIKASSSYQKGCIYSVSETRRQKRKKIGSVDGQDTFTEERVPGIPDHAYDCVRYMAGYRIAYVPKQQKPKILKGTFSGAITDLKNQRSRYGDVGYGVRTF